MPGNQRKSSIGQKTWRQQRMMNFACFRLPAEVAHSPEAHEQEGHEVPVRELRLRKRRKGSIRQARPVQAHQRAALSLSDLWL